MRLPCHKSSFMHFLLYFTLIKRLSSYCLHQIQTFRPSLVSNIITIKLAHFHDYCGLQKLNVLKFSFNSAFKEKHSTFLPHHLQTTDNQQYPYITLVFAKQSWHYHFFYMESLATTPFACHNQSTGAFH